MDTKHTNGTVERDEIREAIAQASDETVSRLLRASIAVEQNKGKKSESQEQYIVRLESQVSTLKMLAFKAADRFEALWDRVYGYQPDLDIDVLSVEEMIEYLDAAKFLEKYFGRKNNYVGVVEERIKTWKI